MTKLAYAVVFVALLAFYKGMITKEVFLVLFGVSGALLILFDEEKVVEVEVIKTVEKVVEKEVEVEVEKEVEKVVEREVVVEDKAARKEVGILTAMNSRLKREVEKLEREKQTLLDKVQDLENDLHLEKDKVFDLFEGSDDTLRGVPVE